MSVPLAKLLATIGLNPNAITSISNLLAIASVVTLVWVENPWWFPLLWLMALFFDMADGIVARVTGQTSASGSFYDHMTDLLKLILLFMGVGLRYDEVGIWLLAYSVNALFLFTIIVSHVNSSRSKRLAEAESVRSEATSKASSVVVQEDSKSKLKIFMARHPRIKAWLLAVYSSVFVMYGNAMVLLLPLSFGKAWAVGAMILFALVTSRSLLQSLRAVAIVNRRFGEINASWK